MSFEVDHLGRFTSSGISNIMNSGKLTKGNQTYIEQKVAEIITGQLPEISSWAIEHGNLYEPDAVSYYEISNDIDVYAKNDNQLFHEYGEHAGGTPDGLIGEHGALEVKCPYNSVNHVKAALIENDKDFKRYKKEYYWQCHSVLLFTNRQWIDFVSYDPRVAGDLRMVTYQVCRNAKNDREIKRCLDMAIEEKERILKHLKTK